MIITENGIDREATAADIAKLNKLKEELLAASSNSPEQRIQKLESQLEALTAGYKEGVQSA